MDYRKYMDIHRLVRTNNRMECKHFHLEINDIDCFFTIEINFHFYGFGFFQILIKLWI